MNLTCPVLILAVDDEPTLCFLTKEFLEASGYIKVDTAGSVCEAQAAAAQKHYDVIVSDYQMPGENGIQFLKSLRASGDMTPFILFTGKGREEVVIEAFENGADAYLQKGGDPRSLFVEMEHRIGALVQKHQAEAARQESESDFRTLFESSPDPIVLVSPDGKIMNTNQASARMVLMSKEEIIGRSVSDLGIFSENDLNLFQRAMTAIMKGEAVPPVVSQFHRKDGTNRWVELRASVVMRSGRVHAIQIIGRDITNTKQIEDALRGANRQLSVAMDLAQLVYWEYDENSDMYTFNDRFYDLYGTDVEREGGYSVSRMTYYRNFIHPDDIDYVKGIAARAPNYLNDNLHFSHRIVRRDGEVRSIEVYPCHTKDDKGNVTKIFGVNQDITERQMLDLHLTQLNRRLVAIKECNRALVRAQTEKELLEEVCRIVCDVAGYRMAWIGMAEHDDERSVRPVVWKGFENGYVAGVKATWGEDPRGMGPTGMAIKTGRTVFIQDFANDGTTGPWRDNASKNGYRSSIAIPLKDSGVAFGAFMLYSGEIDDFTHDELELLEELAGDLAFGIVALRTRDERQKIGEVLKSSNEKYQTLFEANGDCTWVIDQETGQIIDVNSAATKMYGYDREEFIRKNILDISAEPEKTWKAIHPVKNFIPLRYHKRKDGTIFPVEIISNTLEIVGRTTIIGTARDISERIKAEEALRESEARYRSLFQENSAPMFIVDPAIGDIAEANQAACEYYGYERSDLLKMNVSQINILSPEEVKKEMERSVRGGKRKFDFKHRLASGEVRDVEVYSSPIYLDGKHFLYSIVHDVTDRNRFEKALTEREEQYSKLLATVPDFVITADMNGNIILVNEPALTQTGYKMEEVQGHSLFSFVADEDKGKALKNIGLMVKGRLGSVGYNFVMKDGGHVPIEVNGDVLRDSEGIPTGLVFIGRNMTERHQMVSELNETKEKLIVMYNITRHDINNQLMALSSYLSLMERNGSDHASNGYLRNAEAAVKRISSMVDFTKEYENVGVNAPVWHDIRTLTDKCIKEADLGKIAVTNDIPEGTEVFADPMFFKVIQNLMNNSIRHGDKVTRLRLSIEEKDTGGSIIFDDDGIGIPAKMKENLFAKGSGKDHGLGLFLCKEILAMTGINILEEGEPGKGARFVMTPRKDGMRRI